MTLPAAVMPTPRSADRSDTAIALACCGPAEHGVTRLARQITDAAEHAGFGGTILSEPDPLAIGDLARQLPVAVRLLHLHVNDWLFAGDGMNAAERLGALAHRLRQRGVGLALTLHDLPQPSDGPELFRRRANSYREFVRCADGALVSSEHERALLQALTLSPTDLSGHIGKSLSAPDIEVIPLPIDAAPAAPPGPGTPTPTIGIFGYLYPGKGHREVLEELAGMTQQISVIAIGRPSDRHDDLLPELAAVARRGGLEFRCTGYVADELVAGRLRAVTVPLAPHTHVSASGSINSWIAAGRRPLVPAGRYVGELDSRLPGVVWIYQPGGLRSSVERALAHPELTWLPAGFDAGPTTAEVADGYLSWLRRLLARGDGVNQQPATPSSPTAPGNVVPRRTASPV